MKWYAYILIGLGIAAGLILFRFAYDWFRTPSEPRPSQVQPQPQPPRLTPERLRELAQPHLQSCTEECNRALERRIGELRAYLQERRKNCRAFADEVLSFTSKFKLLVWGDSHIREAFHRHIFSPEELESRVRQTVELYLQDVVNAENKMLVNLQKDIATVAPEISIANASAEDLRKVYEKALQMTKEHMQSSLKEDVIREISVTIASEVLAVVARQLALRSGLLAAGASSGWFTFGAGLVVAVVIDMIWDWFRDPAGQLAAKLDGELAKLEGLIIDGQPGLEGLRAALAKWSEARQKLREKAVLALADTK